MARGGGGKNLAPAKSSGFGKGNRSSAFGSAAGGRGGKGSKMPGGSMKAQGGGHGGFGASGSASVPRGRAGSVPRVRTSLGRGR